jgi:flagellar hook-basal body complex protein FliE
MVDIVNPLQAANAYTSTSKVADLGAGSAKAGQPSFGDMIQSYVEDGIKTLERSEKTSADAILGKASLIDVTQAVSAAGLKVQEMTAVRDGAVEAYQRIMQMPI